MREHFVDLRLPPAERARLGARSAILASPTVNKLFNQLQGEALRLMLPRPPQDDGERMIARMKLGRRFDELQAAVRRELGADVGPGHGH